MQICRISLNAAAAQNGPNIHRQGSIMALVARVKKPGGVDQFELVELALPAPGPGEILLRHTAIGVNFIDIYQRSGLYPLPPAAVPGVEGAGVVAATGPGVNSPKAGDRVAYAGAPVGAYASERLLPAWRAVPIPDLLADAVAAVSLSRGLTAHMLMNRIYPVASGTAVLVHAAAGGLGTLLGQWGKRRGAVMIGTVGSQDKAAVARTAGFNLVIVGRDTDFVTTVLELTGGRGVDVAYDGIGGDTLAKTCACVRLFGTVASIGQAGGPIPPLSVEELGPRRSLFLARPSVMAYMNERGTYEAAAREVLAAVSQGLAPLLGRAYPLAEAATAHADLEAGHSTGCLYLVP
jgi:NADPH2:quinone reductase